MAAWYILPWQSPLSLNPARLLKAPVLVGLTPTRRQVFPIEVTFFPAWFLRAAGGDSARGTGWRRRPALVQPEHQFNILNRGERCAFAKIVEARDYDALLCIAVHHQLDEVRVL